MPRHCPACDTVKDVEMFSIDRHRADGRSRYCRACRKRKHAEWLSANKHRATASSRAWHEANRDSVRAASRRYTAKNLEDCRRRSNRCAQKLNERKKADPGAARPYRRHAEEETRRCRQRRQEEKARRTEAGRRKRLEDDAEHQRQRRASKLRTQVESISLSRLNERAAVFGHRCAYCRGPHEHWDHVIPLARGGRHILSNLRPSCASCNLHKSAAHPRRWLNRAHLQTSMVGATVSPELGRSPGQAS